MADKATPSHRYRMTIPAKDTTVLRWIEQQSSLSTSLRMLIRWAIQEYGYSDVTCLTVRRDRGRPNQTAAAMNYEPMQAPYEAEPVSVPQTVPQSMPVYPAQAPTPAQVFVPAATAVPQTPSVPTTAVQQPVVPPVQTVASGVPAESVPPVSNEEHRNIPSLEDLLI